MTIQAAIKAFHAAKLEADRIQSLPNAVYNSQQHYAAVDYASLCTIRMINHPDWSAELADKHYPGNISDIAYPVSC